MFQYVALLRGINVNGHRIVKMAELRASLERDDGFTSVKTWMQSGNVLFQSTLRAEVIDSKIREVLHADFALDDVPIMIRTAREIQETVASNPFLPPKHEAKRIFVAFLDRVPCPNLRKKMGQIDYSPEEYKLDEELKIIYFYVPDFAKYKLDTTLFEKKLEVIATSRNWRTVNKLAEMASSSSNATTAAAVPKKEQASKKKAAKQPAEPQRRSKRNRN